MMATTLTLALGSVVPDTRIWNEIGWWKSYLTTINRLGYGITLEVNPNWILALSRNAK